MDDQEDLLRFEWGICAVCGVATASKPSLYVMKWVEMYDPWNGVSERKVIDHTKPKITQPSMLCFTHQKHWGGGANCTQSFHQWVRSQPDSHLLFHEFEMECPQCIPCPVCEDELPMENDYLCRACRFGE